MVQYRGDANRIYAASSKGELLYRKTVTDEKNGFIEITKNDETARIDYVNGVVHVADGIRARTPMEAPDDDAGGFCHRQRGQTFGACFKKVSDDFCDSFISCVALYTQPSVSVVIGIACSCYAK